MSSAAASPKASPPAPATSRASRRSLAQELGLVVVVVLLGGILAIYGWQDAAPGRPNTFLNFDNLIDGIATPMPYYAIMAGGVTLWIMAGGAGRGGGLAECAPGCVGGGGAADRDIGACWDRDVVRGDQWRADREFK